MTIRTTHNRYTYSQGRFSSSEIKICFTTYRNNYKGSIIKPLHAHRSFQELLVKSLFVFALFLVFPFTALATEYQGSCSIVFQGSSTLHDFEGKGNCEPFTVSETGGIMNVPELVVAVAGMDTDNSKRDKKMHEMFNSDLYPLIKGSTGPVIIGEIRKALKENGDSTEEVLFELTIREIVKPVTATLQNIVETGSTITADMVFSVSLAEYKLKPPSVLGIIRVGDQVNVTASFSLAGR